MIGNHTDIRNEDEAKHFYWTGMPVFVIQTMPLLRLLLHFYAYAINYWTLQGKSKKWESTHCNESVEKRFDKFKCVIKFKSKYEEF